MKKVLVLLLAATLILLCACGETRVEESPSSGVPVSPAATDAADAASGEPAVPEISETPKPSESPTPSSVSAPSPSASPSETSADPEESVSPAASQSPAPTEPEETPAAPSETPSPEPTEAEPSPTPTEPEELPSPEPTEEPSPESSEEPSPEPALPYSEETADTVLHVCGAGVDRDYYFTMSELQSLGGSFYDSYFSRGKEPPEDTNTFEGIIVSYLLDNVVSLTSDARKVQFVAADGYGSSFSLSQIRAAYLDETDLSKTLYMILAWSQDGDYLGGSLRLVMGQSVEGEYNRQYWARDVVTLQVGT